MFKQYQLLFLVLFSLPIPFARGEAPDNPRENADDMITPEARAIEKELRQKLASDSEAIAMLDAVVKGSTLGGDDGWFPLAKAKSKFDWNYVVKTFDSNTDEEITQQEFTGTEVDFARLDLSGDKKLSTTDFDWSEHSLVPTPGFIMFFMADRDANGKVTREEFAAVFDQLTGNDASYLALDDLRPQFQPAPRGDREHRADRPTRSTLIAALQRQEIGSLQAGPDIGDTAPDFTLSNLHGESVTMSDEVGEKPIVLIFGNFTCGPFRSQSGNIEKLYQRYQDRAKFFLVYVREAHPSDGWWMSSNQRAGIDLTQPIEQNGRRVVAQKCQAHLALDIPFLVDVIDDRVGSLYSGMPNRLYLIDQQGKVVFKNGRGPFGFHPRELEQSLVLLLCSANDAVEQSQ